MREKAQGISKWVFCDHPEIVQRRKNNLEGSKTSTKHHLYRGLYEEATCMFLHKKLEELVIKGVLQPVKNHDMILKG